MDGVQQQNHVLSNIKNFSWVVPNVLAGSSSIPLTEAITDRDTVTAMQPAVPPAVEFLKRQGVRSVLNLTEHVHPYAAFCEDGPTAETVRSTTTDNGGTCGRSSVYSRSGIVGLHVPVADFERPTMAQMRAVADMVVAGGVGSGGGDACGSASSAEGGCEVSSSLLPMVIHCRAGIGRTSTMLAVAVQALRLKELADGGTSDTIDSQIKAVYYKAYADGLHVLLQRKANPIDEDGASEEEQQRIPLSLEGLVYEGEDVASIPDVVLFLRTLRKEACKVPVQLEAVKEFVATYRYDPAGGKSQKFKGVSRPVIGKAPA